MTSSFLPEDNKKIDETSITENVEFEINEHEKEIAELDKKLDYALMKLILSDKKRVN